MRFFAGKADQACKVIAAPHLAGLWMTATPIAYYPWAPLVWHAPFCGLGTETLVKDRVQSSASSYADGVLQ